MPSHRNNYGPIDKFQSDLRCLSLSEVIQKHITTGNPVALSQDDYFDLRNKVARQFEIHPNSVILVGSTRLGFSIAPSKRYRMRKPRSDFDVAIISAEKFDQYWEEVFIYSNNDADWRSSRSYKKLLKMLFQGWIDPKGLPNVPRFKQAEQWREFFDSLMRSRRYGNRRITARLYRSWARLEIYQGKAVLQCLE